MKSFDSVMSERFRRLFTTGLLVIILLAVVFGGWKLKEWIETRGTAAVASAYVKGRVKDVSGMTAEDMVYSGLLRVDKGELPHITDSACYMVYTADVRADFDVSDVGVEVEGSDVTVDLPEAELTLCKVRADSIEFYDFKGKRIKWNGKDGFEEAEKLALEDVAEGADFDTMRENVRDKAGSIIYEMIKDGVDGRKISFTYAGSAEKGGGRR